jgi:lysozyme
MKPSIPKDKLLPIINRVWVETGNDDPLPAAFAWSCRGYYRDSLGKPGVNDRGINDDAIGFISDQVDVRIRANVDPSVYRKGVSSLKTRQVVWYVPGWHGYASIYGHSAFRQDSPVIVKRDGTESFSKGTIHKKYGVCLGSGYWTDLGFGERFWTNLHRQSGSGTSSLGCQTVPMPEWTGFRAIIMSELARLSMTRFPCIILDGPIN